ncbi:hypothetical protein Y032_0391g568 [Ancylostoma ceylanicum]|uniref:Uncharacterized protein n=1 Tax=Ancylostoma ceylanicum TaxID=53326 RepID=A0A016RS57_9BILA|nr:hypothetical protein Y032_0391g568 [Ancylostoma ceylanicum]
MHLCTRSNDKPKVIVVHSRKILFFLAPILFGHPVVSSPFAEVALLDDPLPKEVERSIQIRETDLRSLNETLINTLNISLGLDPYRAMPSYKRLPLVGTIVVHRMSQAVHPELIGRDLRNELASAESTLKSVPKLRAQRSRKRD